MKKYRKMRQALLCLLLCTVMLFGCSGKDGKSENGLVTPEAKNPTSGAEFTPGATAALTPTPAVDLDTPEALAEQAEFDEFLSRVFQEVLSEQDSITLHFLMEHPENYGFTPSYSLGEVTEDEQDYAKKCESYQKELLTFQYDLLTESQKVNYDRLEYECRVGIQAATLKPCYSSMFAQNGNVISNSSTYYTEYMICEEKDAEDYLKLLEMYPDFIASALMQAEEDWADGILPTKTMLETTIETAEDLLSTSEHPFVVAYRENLRELSGISDDAVASYTERAQEIVSDKVVPALQSFIERLRKAVQEGTYAEPEGLCSKDGGKEYYEYLAQTKLGTEMTAEEMYDYVEEKAQSMIRSYMTMLMLDSGVIDRYEAAFYHISEPEDILNQLKEEIKDKFPAIKETEFTVSYLPEVLETDGVVAYYLSPQIDNTARKIIRVNGSAVGEDSISLYSTLAHEGYPGHLYQDEYFISTEGYHEINAVFSYLGYQEGWATMVGSMAYEWCCGDKNVAACYNFDYDFSMLLAAWADIGVNYYGWDVDQVYEMLSDNYVESYEVAEMFYEMAVSDPGIYLPYTLGYHLTKDTIQSLEDKGMSETEAFEAFLNVGPCSFEVLYKHLGLE